MKSKNTGKVSIQGAIGIWMSIAGAFLIPTNADLNIPASCAMVAIIVGNCLLALAYYKSLGIATADEWDDIRDDNVA